MRLKLNLTITLIYDNRENFENFDMCTKFSNFVFTEDSHSHQSVKLSS